MRQSVAVKKAGVLLAIKKAWLVALAALVAVVRIPLAVLAKVQEMVVVTVQMAVQ